MCVRLHRAKSNLISKYVIAQVRRECQKMNRLSSEIVIVSVVESQSLKEASY